MLNFFSKRNFPKVNATMIVVLFYKVNKSE